MIQLADINWQTVIAALAVTTTIIYNVVKHRTVSKSTQETLLHNNVNELTLIYKELVDDLREEVNRMREENKLLTENVVQLTSRLKQFESTNRSLQRSNRELQKKLAVLEAHMQAEVKNAAARDQRDNPST